MPTAKEISFGKFRLDLVNECLLQGARSIPLRPKAFAVLKLLIENPGLLVTKQQVLDSVWPGTFVGDAVLKDNIRQLREALNDDAASPNYIETSHRRGYRFIGKLSQASSGATNAPKVQPRVSAPISEKTDVVPSQERAVLGRELELSRMDDFLKRALAGQRQLVFVTGEPGIGKTTLVQAFLDQAVRIPNLRIARGQCLEHYGAGEAYMPVLDGFLRLCRSAEGGQTLEVLRERAPAWLAQMPTLLPQSERSDLQARSAGATRERILREMADAIEAMTAHSPMLLVLEDLHWSDYSTLDLLSYLARREDPARLMVIGTYRPVDVILTDHPLKRVKRELQAHSLCDELSLEYLSETDVQEYLDVRFPGNHFPPRLRRTIYQRTEGNPLFMVNLVEYLMDQKFITGRPGFWELVIEVSQVEKEVPINLRQLIEQQIERLNPDERAVLEAASIAGMECSSVAIAAGLDKPLEWVEQHCEELARRHQFLSPAWLFELPDGTVTPRHRFIHVLYKDVPYRLMAPMRRSQIHHRIAERGIAIYGERAGEIAAELAMHFEQSHDWPRALQFILQAAEKAVGRSAHHEAIDLANRGLEALKLLPNRDEHAKQEMKLRMILGTSLMAIKGFASAEVETVNAASRELFWRHGPSPELFYMLWAQNFYQQFSGDMHSSLGISHQLMQLAHDLNSEALIMEAHQSLGALLVLFGRCPEALEHIEKGSAFYAAHGSHRYAVFRNFDSKVMFDCFAALAHLELGYLDKSSAILSDALALARELNHPQTLVTTLHIVAQRHQLLGEPSLAYETAKESLELSNECGFAVWRTYGLVELGWAEAEMGNPESGFEKMREGLAEYEATGAKLRTPYFLSLLADQLRKNGRIEEGLAVITNAIVLAGKTGEGYGLPELHRIKGDLLMTASAQNSSGSAKLSEASACFAEAVNIAKQQGARWRQLRAALSIDSLEMKQRNWAHTQLAEVYSSFTEGFETADLKQAKAQLSMTPPD